MTDALDDVLHRAAPDDEVQVINLAADGEHFSAGHDIGTPPRDADRPFPQGQARWDHTSHQGAGAASFARVTSGWGSAAGGVTKPSRQSSRFTEPASPGG